ncbi:winged helix DNA-binding domain-containing protein [Streptantibioticus ferralitis]|uniref:Winged helix DNA-binding domain-containing protein n=1 Tax=Streptantibioticus ferralitis TaxID=236510 RepID=A0ABT5YXN6_9ACTN|nr:winged helix DNA-binding domain-containing protein [Streptantibioticus ferralitis]MDF2256172.1 winged helix DNA-binding domain-containing protein [Streptantibioticus ferralitis]
MSARPRVAAGQRRARLGVRHLLAPGAKGAAVEDVAHALVALHATDPATVHLAACARLTAPSVAEVERGLYDDLTLARMLCMRRTMFVVPAELAPVVNASTARPVALRERAHHAKLLLRAGGFTAEWIAAAEEAALAALRERGQAGAAELAADVPALREQIVVSPGKPYEARQRVSSRILGVLAAEGRIRRARPLGGWTSSQFRWAVAEPLARLPEGPAKADLARRYLASFGPVTADDLKWWTGWTLTDTRKAIAATGAVAVDLDEGTGHLLPDDTESIAEPEPWAALLPALDPTAMGWRHRDWYADPELRQPLFDRNGNIGPTVWWNGRVIGGWAQRPDGSIAYRLLTDAGRQARSAIGAEADRLAGWLGGTRIRPSFRTPLERELTG